MSHPTKSPRRLIEVALPLDAISAGCRQDQNPFLKGHPRSIHLWWARRPLAAARAVIFAQLVNDPGYQQGGGFKYGKNKKEAAIERKRLFKIIEDLVLWKNTTNEEVLERARDEIRRSWREVCALNKDHPQVTELFDPDTLPVLHDPFAGGGAIPLEAQRLRLEVYASDLNPVAVLINKLMVEIPPRFAGRHPVSLASQQHRSRQSDLLLDHAWRGASGLAEDVRHYGAWIQAEAQKRIGHLYPPVEITGQMVSERPDLQECVGQKLRVIAWLWARTVRSPNPAFSHVEVPLISTFVLCRKAGKEAYVQPIVNGDQYRFGVRRGEPPQTAESGTKASGRGANFRCLLSDAPISGDYIKSEGQAGRLGQRLFAVVGDTKRGRAYLSPTERIEAVARTTEPSWYPTGDIPKKMTGGTCVPYGLEKWGDLFSARQLVALSTFGDLILEVRNEIHKDAVGAGMAAGEAPFPLESGGGGAAAYADAVSLYLATGLSQLLRYSCTTCTWNIANENVAQAFGRQAFPIIWDFAESHPISGSLAIDVTIGWVAAALEQLPASVPGRSEQKDARTAPGSRGFVVSTDPPYYNNIAYADLSDFFYVWLRRSVKPILPSLFSTIAVPKAEELIAKAARHGSRELAESFFLEGMTAAMNVLARSGHPAIPVTIYYAFKQAETDQGETASTGWETFLEAVLRSGFQLSGTWPMCTERTEGLKGGVNALASSIILVCRQRPADASTISRREFIRELDAVLPEALDEMTKGSGDDRSPVAPVDLSQAIIGPGMAVFSKYAAVLEADGSPMSVHTALQLINRFLAEDDFDADTQFCLHWFEQHGWTVGAFGDADTLSRGKGTSVDGMKDAGVLQSGGGKVRLLKWAEYPTEWNPRTDARTPVWEGLHQLIRALKQGGESASAGLLSALGGKAEAARQLAYRLYTLCERLGQAEDARVYNELITSWTGIESAAAHAPIPSDGLLPGFED